MDNEILIIDDSEMIRSRLVSLITEIPGAHIVGQASNIKDGYDLFYSLRPDTIILDISMPGESGIKLLEKIKQESPDTIVIMLTNYSYPTYRQYCEKLGADFFLDKSMEFDKIPELIKLYLEQNNTVIHAEFDMP